MKISFLTSEYPHQKVNNKGGGIGTSIKNLATGLIKNNQEVVVFVIEQDTEEEFIDDGIQIILIKKHRSKYLSFWFKSKYIERVVNQYIIKLGINSIEAPDWTGMTAFMKLKCPVFIRLHGTDTYFCSIENRKQKYKNFFLEKKALKKADYIISVSDYCAQKTKELFSLSKPIEIIYNGIDTTKFEYQNVQGQEKIILYVGTLIRKKGVLELPFIFNEVHKKDPNTKLVLIGKDAKDYKEQESTWEIMKKSFDPTALSCVDYKGFVSYEGVNKCINESTVCVFPSFAEAFPVSWLEAMAKGKVVVASDIGWAFEMITHEKDGFLVDPKNHVLYANNIINALENKELSQKISEEAHKTIITRFDIDIIAQQNIDFFKSKIQSNNKSK